MDESVRAALRKWPHVPDCFDWLGLDARGDWYMRDERAQAAGPFPQSKGSRIEHDALRAFIGRNYQADTVGRWYFQNGPQKVYVSLAASPWVWRLQPQAALRSHTGLSAVYQSAWLDEFGRLFLATDLGLGLVHTQDMADAAELVSSDTWRPQEIEFAELPRRFAYVLSPAKG